MLNPQQLYMEYDLIKCFATLKNLYSIQVVHSSSFHIHIKQLDIRSVSGHERWERTHLSLMISSHCHPPFGSEASGTNQKLD